MKKRVQYGLGLAAFFFVCFIIYRVKWGKTFTVGNVKQPTVFSYQGFGGFHSAVSVNIKGDIQGRVVVKLYSCKKQVYLPPDGSSDYYQVVVHGKVDKTLYSDFLDRQICVSYTPRTVTSDHLAITVKF